MEKISLNKYEQYLSSQPLDKKFSDPRVQRAFVNLKRARSQNLSAEILSAGGDRSPANAAAIVQERTEAANHVRKNRGAMYQSQGQKVMSPFSTKKDKYGNAVSNDVLTKKNLTPKLKTKDNVFNGSLPKDKNKFLAKAKSFIKRRPIASGLIALGSGAVVGAAAYGIKKDIEG